jgi:hypothetical protein
MSNLKDLFISQSFYGIVNLEDSTSPLTSQSGDLELQDGIGDNLGLRINATTKEFTVVNNFKVDGNADFNGDVDISGSVVHSGSLDVHGNITAHTGSFDTINTRVLHVTLESSSVIFSSGSNQLGDEITDVQELIGQVTISGSLGVQGNSAFTGSLTVSNEISSSTINGIGNVTTYSASVDSRLDQLEADSGSQAGRLDNLELFTSSQETINGFYNSFTASNGNDSLNAFTSSQLDINSGYNTFTSSYYVDSASFDTRIDALEAFSSSIVTDFVSTTDFNTYTQSQDDLNVTFATTGSNTFVGNNTFSGSVNGEVNSLSIVSSTASMDLSLGNFFTINLVSNQTTRLVTTNVQPGQTVNLKVQQVGGAPFGNLVADDNVKYSTISPYTASQVGSAIDVISYITFDDTNLFGSSVKRFI